MSEASVLRSDAEVRVKMARRRAAHLGFELLQAQALFVLRHTAWGHTLSPRTLDGIEAWLDEQASPAPKGST
jgi:hypothetical protein